jgi:hypothetical protein
METRTTISTTSTDHCHHKEEITGYAFVGKIDEG